MAVGIACYRLLMSAAEALLRPAARAVAPAGSRFRGAFTPPPPSAEAARGSVWIHAASMGEVVAARRWALELAHHGARLPFYLTTRTGTGLARARRELPDQAVAAIAPFDGPRAVHEALDSLRPARIDVLETEIWPNWVLAARAARIPVVFVSAVISERTRRGLIRLGVARSGLLAEGVWVLAQSRAHADRFQALGVPEGRIAVVGDVKAEPPGSEPLEPTFRRRFVVFGSERTGEEEAAVALAAAVREARPARRLVVAPRHPGAARRVRAALRRAGAAVDVRGERNRSREPLRAWLDRLASAPGNRVGVLRTRGELATLYGEAAVAVVGGTFAPYGGHNVLEPAARGCPVVVGPHHENVLAALEVLAPEGAVEVVPDARQLGALVSFLLLKPDQLDRSGAGALRAAAAAAGAAGRAYAALLDFGLAEAGREGTT